MHRNWVTTFLFRIFLTNLQLFILVESARAIGTGRVGGGLNMRQNSQPTFATNEKDFQVNGSAINRRNVIGTTPNTTIDSNNYKRTTVQDRLNRNRNYFDESATNSNQPEHPHTIIKS